MNPPPLPPHLAYLVSQHRRGVKMSDIGEDLAAHPGSLTVWRRKAREQILLGKARDPDLDLISADDARLLKAYADTSARTLRYRHVAAERLGLDLRHQLIVERLVEKFRDVSWYRAAQTILCDVRAKTAPPLVIDLETLRSFERPSGMAKQRDSGRQTKAEARLARHAAAIRNSIEIYNRAAVIVGKPQLEDFPAERQ